MTIPVTLTLNAGSSSLKFSMYNIAGDGEPQLMAMGEVEKIGSQPRLKTQVGVKGAEVTRDLAAAEAKDHSSALNTALGLLREKFPEAQASVVGHRVVHGGPHFTEAVVIDDAILEELRRLSPLAPLHEPHNIAGVEAAKVHFPDALQVACFDTAFHRRHPKVNDMFAIPREYYEKGVRRYGFHGLSYEYISGELKEIAPLLHAGRVVVAHLGNGASMCAILNGRSVASTMGFTPLDGLPMGTRCGQIDPGVIFYLLQQEGLSVDDVRKMLYDKSGLLGLSGLSNDMRVLLNAQVPEAHEAIDYFVFRIRRELGGLAATLGGVDALVFCGGIGENAVEIRRRICEDLSWIGIEVDTNKNESNALVISTEFSRTRVMVIPTNEELVIARAAKRLLAEHQQKKA
ncbi:acetate/propionate family kinase [Xanthobacter sp. TB0136]|uniref:acetate/propionate family kinase n=1 Tax=Xanthobacter sp. TB0136 TaxID=3459177 RepID=UPI0040392113